MKNSESNFRFIIYFSDSDCELLIDDSFIQTRIIPNPIVDTPNLSLRWLINLVIRKGPIEKPSNFEPKILAP